MSRGYKARQKRIRDAKKNCVLVFKRIPDNEFHQLQAAWDREITGPPIGTLQDMILRE